MSENLRCPACGSESIVKNGFNRLGKQSYKCRDCGRQFVENPGWHPIEVHEIVLVEQLERLPLAGIARILQFSERWLQRFVNLYDQKVPRQVQLPSIDPNALKIVQMDELWSFVQNKGHKQWVWLALDTTTALIVGCHVGDRSSKSCQGLWDSLPESYHQGALYVTDFWEAYSAVLPPESHQAGGKETALTCMVERFNNTLRQRVARLVRKTLSFSKKLDNHVGAIWLFIHHYNSERLRHLAL
jgi:IS1 family transposase/DNA-directed RNA polymerase subunit RPC12/RpoP